MTYNIILIWSFLPLLLLRQKYFTSTKFDTSYWHVANNCQFGFMYTFSLLPPVTRETLNMTTKHTIKHVITFYSTAVNIIGAFLLKETQVIVGWWIWWIYSPIYAFDPLFIIRAMSISTTIIYCINNIWNKNNILKIKLNWFTKLKHNEMQW